LSSSISSPPSPAYSDGDVLGAADAGSHVGESLTAHDEGGAGLGARWDGHLLGALEGRNLDGTAEGSGGEGDGHLAEEVAPAPPEDLVGLDVDEDVEIAGGRAPLARFAGAADSDGGAVLDAGWNLDRHFGLGEAAAGAAAGLAGVGDDLARSLADAAGGDGGEPAERGGGGVLGLA
jgi:hypothetical protein